MYATAGDTSLKTLTVRPSLSVRPLAGRLAKELDEGLDCSKRSIRSRFSRQSRKSMPRSVSSDLSSPTDSLLRPPVPPPPSLPRAIGCGVRKASGAAEALRCWAIGLIAKPIESSQRANRRTESMCVRERRVLVEQCVGVDASDGRENTRRVCQMFVSGKFGCAERKFRGTPLSEAGASLAHDVPGTPCTKYKAGSTGHSTLFGRLPPPKALRQSHDGRVQVRMTPYHLLMSDRAARPSSPAGRASSSCVLRLVQNEHATIGRSRSLWA